MFHTNIKWLTLAVTLSLAACATPPKATVALSTLPSPAKPPSTATPSVAPAPVAPFVASNWSDLPDWKSLNLSPSFPALMQSCHVLKIKPLWHDICASAGRLNAEDSATLHAFYETWFSPFQVRNPDGSNHGMITGYYEPKLYGSRTRSKRFRFPLYATPDDLLTIDLGAVYPELKHLRLRGRLQGNRVVPYYSRSEIDAKGNAIKARELFWVDDALALFFLQIQGSGRIELTDGTLQKVGYANQNGHPYVSIGKKLVEMGEIKLEQASMQGIKHWAQNNPYKLPALLAQNPSYVFFRDLPGGLSSPPGALGIPLTAEYSLAVDPRTIPLGSPVFLSTTYPNNHAPLNRLMLAQDTGGAIKGAVRADFFWGFGKTAANQAGKMKQQGKMWVLFPKGGEPLVN